MQQATDGPVIANSYCAARRCLNPQNSFKFNWRSESFQKYQTGCAEFWGKTSRRFPFDGMVQPKKHHMTSVNSWKELETENIHDMIL